VVQLKATLSAGKPVILAGLIAAVMLAAHLRPPVPGAYPACLVKTLTGFYCPGCGGTRALYLLGVGNVAGAAGQNLLVVLAAAGSVVWLAVRLTLRRAIRFGAVAAGLLVLLVVAFAFARNTAAFSWLAPVPLERSSE
jgi:hypothetical protein